jgi:hypothetical protein
MADRDPKAAEFMDAPGTRVTPEPDEHPGHDAGAGARSNATNPDVSDAGADNSAGTEGGTGTSGARGGGPAADFRRE